MNIIKRMRTGVFATAVVGLMTSANLSAQVIADFTFGAASAAATNVDANAAAGNFSLGAGLNVGFSGTGNAYTPFDETATTAISFATAVANDDYFSFTFAADSGYVANFTSLSFDYGYSRLGAIYGDKKQKAYITSSIDNHATILGSMEITGTDTSDSVVYSGTVSADLSGLVFQDIGSSTEFRIYLADTSGHVGYKHRIDNVTLNGTVVVPEPGTYALMGGLLALGSVMMRRRA